MTEAAESPEVLTLQSIRSTADVLERQVLAARRTAEEKIDARRPGSAQFPEDTASAWLAYALWLAEQLGGGAVESTQRPLAQVMHESLADTPATVDLDSGERILIHAKSLDTLLTLEALDADLQQVLGDLHAILAVEESEPFSAGEENFERPRASAVFASAMLKSLAVRMYVWILSHPGAGVPFDESVADPDPPHWTTLLTGKDLDAIVRAHLQVNRRDIDFLLHAFPSTSEGRASRLPLSGFLGAYASEFGLEPRVPMRQRTLRAVIASALAAAQSMREAQAAKERP